MVYFTADQHFFHQNIIRYLKRPFKDTDEMNEFMVEAWNSRVGRRDMIYILGDVSCGKPSATEGILQRLRGRKFLCAGNHDKILVKKLSAYFEGIRDTYFLSIDGQGIFLSHYLHKVWRESHYGVWHLHGHSHGRMNAYAASEGKILDVGVDTHKFKPWSWAEIKEVMESRPFNFNDSRRYVDRTQTASE